MKSVDMQDFRGRHKYFIKVLKFTKLSAHRETFGVEFLKFGEV